MPERLWETIREWRSKGVAITDEAAHMIYALCMRKIEIAHIEDPDYIYLMYPDEVRNFLYRESVNTCTVIAYG